MIRLEKITKIYRTRTGKHTVFRDLDLEIPTGAGVAFLGRNGVGKTTLVNIIGGAEPADSGRIRTDASISWPVGLAGGFQPSLSAKDNVKFVARLYSEKKDISRIVEYVREFAEIEEYFDMPTRTYSSGMRSRVSFGLSMAFDFDYYLIDEVTAVGDPQFRQKCETALLDKRNNKKAGFIVVSHQMDIIRKFCSSAVVLTHEGARHYADVEEAIKVYQANG
jgi:capsular polysaccharide transport system ATP-binding protein